MKHIDKRVYQLVKGDILTSGTEILEAPYDSVKTPRGKTNLTVKYPNGTVRSVQWGKSTTVGVKPKEQQP